MVPEQRDLRATFDPSGGVSTVDITGFGVMEPPEMCGPGQADPLVEALLEGDGESLRDPASGVPPGAQSPSRTELLEVRSSPEAGPLAVRFAIAGIGVDGVELSVFDVTGRRVRSLIHGRLPSGYHEVVWDRTTDSGGPCAAGVYFLRMRASPYVGVRKVVLIR